MDNINNIYSKPGTLKRTYFKKTQRQICLYTPHIVGLLLRYSLSVH